MKTTKFVVTPSDRCILLGKIAMTSGRVETDSQDVPIHCKVHRIQDEYHAVVGITTKGIRFTDQQKQHVKDVAINVAKEIFHVAEGFDWEGVQHIELKRNEQGTFVIDKVVKAVI